ncbi:MAG: signal recognition particle-docking protein FtsY [Bdellovibrionales bacterium]|nr:signal recognition particle-docking protein FtsY [Bdellovibrionales bacterium]
MQSLIESANNFIFSINPNDLLFAIFAISTVSLIAAMFAVRKASSAGKIELPKELGRASNIAGRVEKLERTLNDFKSQSLRSIELQKLELQHISETLNAIRVKVGADAPEKKDNLEDSPDSDSEDESKSLELNEFSTEEAVLDEQEDSSYKDNLTEDLSLKLAKTRTSFFSKIKEIFSAKPALDEESLEELRAVLVGADIGVKTSEKLITDLQAELNQGKEISREEALALIQDKLRTLLNSADEFSFKKVGNDPLVIMMVGVNGVGKTTTTAKLAAQLKEKGFKVIMAAADTFRAAAVAQIKEWGNRIDVPVISGAENAKPSTVVFEAAKEAKDNNYDILLIDTAGRLHTKSNLMQELEGINNVLSKQIPSAPHEKILVVDGSTGQNALVQAKEFNQAISLTGLVVTKLDGTPKGGIVVAIKDELKIPIRYIGVGESAKDLREFDSNDFVNALFDEDELSIGIEKGTTLSAHAETRQKRRRRRDDVSIANDVH